MREALLLCYLKRSNIPSGSRGLGIITDNSPFVHIVSVKVLGSRATSARVAQGLFTSNYFPAFNPFLILTSA